MASETYENVLREVEQLTDDEQHRLLETLKRQSIDAWFASVDDLAERVSAAWIDPNVSAVDAVREQRREL